MNTIYILLIGFAILGIQYFLSTRNRTFWGAILPTAYIIFLVALSIHEGKSFASFYLPLIGGLALLLGEWIKGREALKKKQEREMRVMKAMDIK
ncbi:hypothetical protein OIO07_17630 [Bacillus paralicheniformis]|jgi:hypothetical protein|uniref:Uncharacterized protein n=1 Tax=Bacillus paralicheniformis TaxID=1648923 RepID=A0A6I7TQU9_9BACI|nr:MULTISPECIES: hypothetical protein [Bacillus]ETB72570.1 hypothetical protein A943_04120 [Bacillus sp. CPSM8]KUL08013.1 hypothetical protein LI7559_15060 [Bacillus licheniformis LMG 7559]KUL16624.1 hypothetical protein LI6934_14895 [Bacillus licheniformis LMG 6934]MBC8624255.1 hypothetical protein [Robertmurraya crescens]POO77353.1 hypothetical protein C1T30_37915 [Bacillus sp. MBGLi97]